ncbi:hypothetical protein F2Q65_04070 [Thiohalocapsa marina]|uniref:Lipoprotein n=1 Tax=Thiohalocapsa marina TaxID=424902 RepID=A0A5M8FQT4_9GAMM|nr:lipoprotein [Thiohalocapsa marina]KAA6186560.1 hypothetical protein F2Q65_04070 [Thiohalocapsa marina]
MHCWARTLFYSIVAVLAIGQMVVACGQKGDLYLPERPPATQADASQSRTGQADTPVPAPDASGDALEALDDVPSTNLPMLPTDAAGL